MPWGSRALKPLYVYSLRAKDAQSTIFVERIRTLPVGNLDGRGTISSDSSKELEKRTLRPNAFPGKKHGRAVPTNPEKMNPRLVAAAQTLLV